MDRTRLRRRADTGTSEPGRAGLSRDRLIMRLLAVERMVRALIVVGIAVAVFDFRESKPRFREVFDSELPALRPIAGQIGWNVDDSKIVRAIDAAFTLSPTALLWIGIGLCGYGVMQIAEAVGLWLARRWGEYLAAVATSIFLPLEIYELTEKVTALRLLTFGVNVAAVAWLVWRKRLFGVRGGGAAYRAERAEQPARNA